MCCCDHPNINGHFGYSWDGKSTGVYPVHPPDLKEGDMLLHDEPGRCGGLDSHSYHYRVVMARFGGLYLYVRHGAGQEYIRLSTEKTLRDRLAAMDSDTRYWILGAIYHASCDADTNSRNTTNGIWQQAAAEKRIKTKKQRGSASVRVWIAAAPLHAGR